MLISVFLNVMPIVALFSQCACNLKLFEVDVALVTGLTVTV